MQTPGKLSHHLTFDVCQKLGESIEEAIPLKIDIEAMRQQEGGSGVFSAQALQVWEHYLENMPPGYYEAIVLIRDLTFHLAQM